jgi:hypothetical protein
MTRRTGASTRTDRHGRKDLFTLGRRGRDEQREVGVHVGDRLLGAQHRTSRSRSEIRGHPHRAELHQVAVADPEDEVGVLHLDAVELEAEDDLMLRVALAERDRAAIVPHDAHASGNLEEPRVLRHEIARPLLEQVEHLGLRRVARASEIAPREPVPLAGKPRKPRAPDERGRARAQVVTNGPGPAFGIAEGLDGRVGGGEREIPGLAARFLRQGHPGPEHRLAAGCHGGVAVRQDGPGGRGGEQGEQASAEGA